MENSITWLGELGFQSKNRHHINILDVQIEKGGKDQGPTPKEILLNSIATCSAMDVISILKKMRDLPETFYVDIDFEMNKSYPIFYTEIKLNYKLTGKIQAKNIIKAVESSLTKYCGVSYMVSKVTKITYSLYLNNEEINNGMAKFVDPIE